jgi:Heterokaryon incompatibility protein (HET)
MNFKTEFLALEHIVPDPKSEDCITRIWTAVEACVVSHTECPANILQPLPSRVINVSSTGDPFLYETGGEYGHYVTLSHCWGSGPVLKTESTTIESRKLGISDSLLSKTFQDAIFITRKLGVQYLWIDSLCIIQDSDADWEIESSKMASIYENSYLTISAASAATGEDGFLSKRKRKSFSETIEIGTLGKIYARDAPIHAAFEPLRFGGVENIPESEYPLFFRGWAMQERILSTRVLHYTSSEWVLECKGGVRCECDNITDSQSRGKEIATALCGSTKFEMWYEIVSEYSVRKLTFKRDRLPALSGLARKFHSSQTGSYLAGLWEKDLAGGLLWKCVDGLTTERPSNYLAPTWSWASVLGPVRFSSRMTPSPYKCAHTEIEIHEIVCTPSGLDQFGGLSAGFIRLTGSLVKAMWQGKLTKGRHSIRSYDVIIDTSQEAGLHQEVYCLLITTANPHEDFRPAALILKQSKPTADTFERIGIVEGPDILDWFHASEGCISKEITIV